MDGGKKYLNLLRIPKLFDILDILCSMWYVKLKFSYLPKVQKNPDGRVQDSIFPISFLLPIGNQEQSTTYLQL